jgi:hypothetical protein
MKKILVSLFVCSILILLFNCTFEPYNVGKNTSTESVDSTFQEREDVLALRHLTIPHVDEDTLASFVMDFLNAGTRTDTARSVQPSTVIISKSTKIIHEVETGFADTTADKRSSRSIIGPGQIPFYVFTLEDQSSGKTGFALTCGDNRIGEVLAIVEEGNYDSDNPGLHIFYSCLSDYIENSIYIYNSITQADIENAVNKRNESRSTAPDVPVTEVGKHGGFIINADYSKDDKLLPVKWGQGEPYNGFLNKQLNVPNGHTYVTGCGPVAMAQIMAFYRWPEKHSKAGPLELGLGHKPVVFDWNSMIPSGAVQPNDNAIGELMYHICIQRHVSFTMGLNSEKMEEKNKENSGASTTMSNTSVINSFKDFGYKDTGNFIAYNFSKVKSAINNERPVMVEGWNGTRTILFGFQTHDGTGHYWVIDGYRRMTTVVKDLSSGLLVNDYPLDYVHCNMGWSGFCNGWFISGVFDTSKDANKNPKNIPWEDPRSAEPGFYKYHLAMLDNINPNK